MRVIVKYRQEVWCEIDTNGESGDRIEHAYSSGGLGPHSIVEVVRDPSEGDAPLSRKLRDKAITIAETEMWPSWH